MKIVGFLFFSFHAKCQLQIMFSFLYWHIFLYEEGKKRSVNMMYSLEIRPC